MTLKISYFELRHEYNVTVVLHLECKYLFFYVWKEETPTYAMVLIACIFDVVFIFKFTEGGNHPLGKLCYIKKGFVRRGFTNITMNFPSQIFAYISCNWNSRAMLNASDCSVLS